MRTLTLIICFFIAGCFGNKNESETNLENKISQVKLTGEITNFGRLVTDDIVDFGLVLKAFEKEKLLDLKLTDLISSEIDTITVIGNKIELPSNLALPKQRERYFISVNLEKAFYKVNFPDNAEKNFVVLHGQFPFKKVVDGFRNDIPLLRLATDFNFLSYSKYNLDPTTKDEVQDLQVGKSILNNTTNILSPSGFGSDFSFIAVSFEELDSLFYPTDLKILKSEESKKIKTLSSNSKVLTGLIHESFSDPISTDILKHKMTLQFQNANELTSTHLEEISSLIYSQPFLKASLPQNALNLNQIGSSLRIYQTHKNQNKLDKDLLVFQKVDLNVWENNVDLTDFENIKTKGSNYRLEYSFHGSKSLVPVTDKNELIESTDYLTTNALIIKN